MATIEDNDSKWMSISSTELPFFFLRASAANHNRVAVARSSNSSRNSAAATAATAQLFEFYS